MFEVFWQDGFSKLFFAHHDKTDAVTGPSDYALVFLILNCKTRYVEKLESLFQEARNRPGLSLVGDVLD